MIKNLINKLMARPGGLSCKEALDTLQSYLDGETDEHTAHCMVEHLDACKGCLGEAEMYRSISSSIRSHARPLDATIVNRLTEYANQIDQVDGTGSSQN